MCCWLKIFDFSFLVKRCLTSRGVRWPNRRLKNWSNRWTGYFCLLYCLLHISACPFWPFSNITLLMHVSQDCNVIAAIILGTFCYCEVIDPLQLTSHTINIISCSEFSCWFHIVIPFPHLLKCSADFSVCSEFQLIHELCLYVLPASQRAELIRATLATLHAFLSWIPLGYIFESPLVCTSLFLLVTC